MCLFSTGEALIDVMSQIRFEMNFFAFPVLWCRLNGCVLEQVGQDTDPTMSHLLHKWQSSKTGKTGA
jgi:hypothetical protein